MRNGRIIPYNIKCMAHFNAGSTTRVPHIWHATPEGLPWSLSHPAARSPKEFVLSSLAILIGAHFTIRIKENLLTTTGACGNGVKCKTPPVWWENLHVLSIFGFPQVRKYETDWTSTTSSTKTPSMEPRHLEICGEEQAHACWAQELIKAIRHQQSCNSSGRAFCPKACPAAADKGSGTTRCRFETGTTMNYSQIDSNRKSTTKWTYKPPEPSLSISGAGQVKN